MLALSGLSIGLIIMFVATGLYVWNMLFGRRR